MFRITDTALSRSGIGDRTSPPQRSEPVVSLQNVSVQFGKKQAVLDATLAINEFEFVSIVGPSGCGKTTILNILAGLIGTDQYSGECRLLQQTPTAGNKAVAYMLARDALCPWLTAFDNVALANKIRRRDKAESRAKARSLLDAVGLLPSADLYPKSLSHGMRQRVALARTFSLDSPVLLMDEPFGALDVFTKIQLADVLLRLWQAERKTVVFVTHDLSEAVYLSDRVIVMSNQTNGIIADVKIDLERPRPLRELQSDPHFQSIVATIWELLETGLRA